MNATEKKYAVNRLEDIAREARAKLGALNCSIHLNDKEIVALLRKGKLKVRSKIDWPGHGSVRLPQVFDLHKHQPAPKASAKQVEKRKNVINRRLQTFKDEIMLGDSASAVKALRI